MGMVLPPLPPFEALSSKVISSSGGKCSITPDDIVSAYKFPFSNSNIILRDQIIGADLYLYININLVEVQVGGRLIGCAFNVDFEVSAFIVDAIPFNGKQKNFAAEVYKEISIHITNLSKFRNAIRDEIEEKSKRFITAYNLDNK